MNFDKMSEKHINTKVITYPDAQGMKEAAELIKKGALVLKLRKSVPRRSAIYALIPCGAPLNPSVIRGSKIYGFIIPRWKNSVKKSDKQ